MFPRVTRHSATLVLLWFAAWMSFGFLLIESLHVAVDWWQGRLSDIGVREGFWLLLLPVLIGVYLRYFSIFRPGCRACELPDPHSANKHHP